MTSNHWCILKGSNSKHYLTQRKTRIGRDTTTNDVILLSQSISKRQCLIDGTNPSNVTLTDSNSRNGTFINGQRTQNATVKLGHGDIIRFGFDCNCYRVELANHPPISSPPPEQHRFDDTRRSDSSRCYNRSYSAPSKLQGANLKIRSSKQTDSVPISRQNPSYLRGENRAAGFMIGSPPTSPIGRHKYNDTASTVVGDLNEMNAMNQINESNESNDNQDVLENEDSNTSHPNLHSRSQSHSRSRSQGPHNLMQSIKSQSVSSSKDEKEMRFLKDAMLRLETKLNTITSISEETKKQNLSLSQQIHENLHPLSPRNGTKGILPSDHLVMNSPTQKSKHYPAFVEKSDRQNPSDDTSHSHKLTSFDAEKMQNLHEIQQKECDDKIAEFYDSVERLSIDKSLQMLNMKIQYLVHLFKSVHDFNAEIPQFLEFSTKYKETMDSKRSDSTKHGKPLTPKLSDFVSLLEYLNDIFDATQCTEISDFITSSQSEILLYRNQRNRRNVTRQCRSTQCNDDERDNLIAVGHSMKEYSNTLQIRLYQLRAILMSKDEKIHSLSNQDWVRQLEAYKNSNCSLNRQIVIQEKDLKRLYKMFSELTERIDRNLPDSTMLRSKILDFVTTYNKKIFHLTSQLSEAQRRKQEKSKNWTEIHEKARRLQSKVKSLNAVLSSQRESFQKSLQEKDLQLIKVNKQLSILAGLHGTNDQEKAAKFLFETLQKYIKENDRYKTNEESLESALRLKVQEVEELQESYQLKVDELRKGDNVQKLQQELRSEREHYGAERIAKLEAMCFELQNNLAERDEKVRHLMDENRKLSESAPLDEVETIEFLSKTLLEKDEHLNKLQGMIDSQTVKIRELEMIETTLRDQTSRHQNEIQEIQQKHQRVNNILGKVKSIKSDPNMMMASSSNNINGMEFELSDHHHHHVMSTTANDENMEWQNDIVDHEIDVSVSAE